MLGAAVVCLLLAVDGPGARPTGRRTTCCSSPPSPGAIALAGARDLATLVVALETATLPDHRAGGPAARPAGGAGRRHVPPHRAHVARAAAARLRTARAGHAGRRTSTGSPPRSASPGCRPACAPSPCSACCSPWPGSPSSSPRCRSTSGRRTRTPAHRCPSRPCCRPCRRPPAPRRSSSCSRVGVLPLAAVVGARPRRPVAAVTITVGNLVALRQRVAVRLLAWSTVAQAGWVLLPLAGAAGRRPGAARGAAAGRGRLSRRLRRGDAGGVRGRRRPRPAPPRRRGAPIDGLPRARPAGAGRRRRARVRPGLPGRPAAGHRRAGRQGRGGPAGRRRGAVAARPGGGRERGPGARLLPALGCAALRRPADDARPASRRWRVRPAEGLALGAAAAACVVLSVWPQVVAGVVPGLVR